MEKQWQTVCKRKRVAIILLIASLVSSVALFCVIGILGKDHPYLGALCLLFLAGCAGTIVLIVLSIVFSIQKAVVKQQRKKGICLPEKQPGRLTSVLDITCLTGVPLTLLIIGGCIPVLGIFFSLVGFFIGVLRWTKSQENPSTQQGRPLLTNALIQRYAVQASRDRPVQFFYLTIFFLAWLPVVSLLGLVIGLRILSGKITNDDLSLYVLEDTIADVNLVTRKDIDGDIYTDVWVLFEHNGSKKKEDWKFISKVRSATGNRWELKTGEIVYLVFSGSTDKLLCTFRQQEWILANDVRISRNEQRSCEE